VPAQSPAPTRLRALQARLDAAIAQYNATQRSFLAVEHSLRQGETRLAALRLAQGSGSASVSSGAVDSQAAPTLPSMSSPPAAAPPAAPPPPPVSATTGAS
jgi:hypothetical protein